MTVSPWWERWLGTRFAEGGTGLMAPQSSHACGNVCGVLTGAYREVLTAAAGSAAALTGLLFVALSVAPRSQAAGYPAVIREVRAAASLLSFTNVLAVSLFGLVPGNKPGYPPLATAVLGSLFTAPDRT